MLTAGERALNIIQGEHAISRDENVVITTILGSCVSACLFDPVLRIGGANHFLLPDAGTDPAEHRYATAAMEALVRSLLRAGADRGRLEAKLFGGAWRMANLPDIGRRNALAAADFLRKEGIPVVSSDLGGTQARGLRFWPATGHARIQRLGSQIPLPVEKPSTALPMRADRV